LEHIEQVKPVTCKSAVDICCAETCAAKISIIMLNNFIVFMIFGIRIFNYSSFRLSDSRWRNLINTDLSFRYTSFEVTDMKNNPNS